MKAQNMSEPISGAAAGVFGFKALGGLAGVGSVGAGLAAFVVMSMTKPKDDKEWRVALACTIVGSISGGSALVQYLSIQHWSQSPFGLCALFGLAFACGLPAWALVRALFKWIEKRRDADLLELAQEVKKVL
jgi:hypothetical protein